MEVSTTRDGTQRLQTSDKGIMVSNWRIIAGGSLENVSDDEAQLMHP